MDLYTLCLLLGAGGLGAMALTGMGRHGAGGARGGHAGSGHAGGGRAGPGHAAPGHAGGAGHGTAAVSSGSGHAAGAASSQGSGHAVGALRGASRGGRGGTRSAGSRALLALASPRTLFSVCLGFGGTGVAFHAVLGEPLLFVAAIAGGILLDRLVVAPIWNMSLRFASRPALTLESCLSEEATAVTSFDANGQGIVAIEMDGQVVQILGTLQATDRAMGVKVHAGERVRIEGVDAARNRCTVSLV
ncbi:MAG TPA: hypothetical protein VMH39_01940 [Gemmatimonadaceae bacterium]|nr:hypothetical protein [Gemmatimonadaceae bacterium]